jgi:hypothetical protein
LNSSPDKINRRYLLDIADGEDERLVEEAILSGALNDSVLQTAEDELIDDYLLGRTTWRERRRFKKRFLTTEDRRQRLRFASALIGYSQGLSSEDKSVKRKVAARGDIWGAFSWRHAAFLGAATSVLLAVLAGFGLMRARQQTQVAQSTRNELTRLQAALVLDNRRTAPVAVPSTGILQAPKGTADRMPTIEFAPATRGGYAVTIRVPAGAQSARINWDPSTYFYKRYREVLLSNGQELCSLEFPAAFLSPTNRRTEVLPSSGQQLCSLEFPAAFVSPPKRSTIVIPTSILVPGQLYHLQLDGDSGGGDFKGLSDSTFRVVRE